MESKEMLDIKASLKKKIESIKGFSEYSEENQNVLLNTFDIKNIKKYIEIDKALKNHKHFVYTKEDSSNIYFTKNPWFAVSHNNSIFQITNHTLFTFLTENKILPMDCKLADKKKKE